MTFKRDRQARSSCMHMLAGVLLLAFGLCPGPARADDSPSLEYQIKASYIFNFAKFVDWPASSTDIDSSKKLNMCFFDAQKFGNALDKLEGQKLGETTISIVRPDPKDKAASLPCNLLFVGEQLSSRESQLITELAGRPVLTVGETSGFLESGGIFEFVRKRGKILFRISVKNAKASNLVIDPQLLGLAIEVQ